MRSTHDPTSRHDRAELAIIGGGPIGLELAVGCRRAHVRAIHFEAGPIGSTMAWWSPDTPFFSSPERIEIAGVPLVIPDQSKATREQYLAYLRAVVQQFRLEVSTFTRVTSIVRDADGFVLETIRSTHGVGGPAEVGGGNGVDGSPRTHHRAKRIALVIGNMHRPRMLGIPGEDRPHVSHYLGEVHQYFRRRVLIVGGKNSAVEAALRLYRGGAHVTMCYHGAAFDPKRVKYWLRPEIEWLISKNNIEFYSRSVLTRIHADSVDLQLLDEPSSPRSIRADFVLLLTGYEQDPSLFRQLGVNLVGDDLAPEHEPQTMQTNVEGVYVAGTAAAGSQKRARLFIENSHVHVRRIIRSIAGIDLPWIDDAEYSALAES